MGSSSESESGDIPHEDNSSPSHFSDASMLESKKNESLKVFEGSAGPQEANEQEPTMEEEETDEIRIDADFPPIRADLGRLVLVEFR